MVRVGIQTESNCCYWEHQKRFQMNGISTDLCTKAHGYYGTCDSEPHRRVFGSETHSMKSVNNTTHRMRRCFGFGVYRWISSGGSSWSWGYPNRRCVICRAGDVFLWWSLLFGTRFDMRSSSDGGTKDQLSTYYLMYLLHLNDVSTSEAIPSFKSFYSQNLGTRCQRPILKMNIYSSFRIMKALRGIKLTIKTNSVFRWVQKGKYASLTSLWICHLVVYYPLKKRLGPKRSTVQG